MNSYTKESNMSKLEDKLGTLKAYREALTNLLKLKMGTMTFKEIDYVNDLNERIIVAINFVEKLLEIEKQTQKIEKEILENGKQERKQ